MAIDSLKFTRSLLRSNGEFRKHFKMWMIPKKDIDAIGFHDGLAVEVVVQCGSLKGTAASVLTSGCEFNIGAGLASDLAALKATDQDEISFTVFFDEAGAERYRLERQVEHRKHDDEDARLKRIAEAPKTPRPRFIRTIAFERNPDIIAQKLFEADGHCYECGQYAPFKRNSDGTPYLEVHHIKPLSLGGEDSLENTIALCPNCHRQFHYGPPSIMP